MFVSELRRGDTFVELAPEDYYALPPALQRKERTYTVKEGPTRCKARPACSHLRLENGSHWCIDDVTPVTLVEKPKRSEVGEAVAAIVEQAHALVTAR